MTRNPLWRYRYQALMSLLLPGVAVLAGGLWLGMSPVTTILLALGLSVGLLVATLLIWWLFSDTLKRQGWEW